jgi:hypothetical protein
VSGSRNFAASHQSYGVGQAGDDHAKDSVGAFASSGGFAICIAARAAASDVPARCNRDRARPRLSTVCALSDPAPREHSAGAPPVPRKLCSGGTACAVRPRAPIRPSQLRRKARKRNARGSKVFTYAGSNQNHRRRRFRIICTNAACAPECAGTKVAGLHQAGFVEASGAMMTALVPHYVAAIAIVQSTPTAARQEEAQPRKLPAINIWTRPGPEDSN